MASLFQSSFEICATIHQVPHHLFACFSFLNQAYQLTLILDVLPLHYYDCAESLFHFLLSEFSSIACKQLVIFFQ